MLKVLHVTSDANIGGAGILLLNLLRHTDRGVFEPLLALPRNSLLLPRAQSLGVRCLTYDGAGDKTLSAAAVSSLFRIVRREKPDILHTNASLSARLASLPFRQIVCIDTKHCCFPPTKRQTSPLFRLAFRTFEKISRVSYIATAEAARQNLLVRGGSDELIRVICGGSEAVSSTTSQQKTALKACLGLPENSFIVGYAARLEKGKGHEVLLAATKLLSQQKNLFFLLVGDGSMAQQLQREASDCPHVIFTGFREDVGALMTLFDINLNCSYLSETSSLSLSEGMSLGIPMIVSDVGGNATMARGCGLVVPPKNPRLLANAILRLQSNPEEYSNFSFVAKQRYQKEYAASLMAEKIQRLYLQKQHR